MGWIGYLKGGRGQWGEMGRIEHRGGSISINIKINVPSLRLRGRGDTVGRPRLWETACRRAN